MKCWDILLPVERCLYVLCSHTFLCCTSVAAKRFRCANYHGWKIKTSTIILGIGHVFCVHCKHKYVLYKSTWIYIKNIWSFALSSCWMKTCRWWFYGRVFVARIQFFPLNSTMWHCQMRVTFIRTKHFTDRSSFQWYRTVLFVCFFNLLRLAVLFIWRFIFVH